MPSNELDMVDVNELICALIRRKQDAFDSMFSLLDLMVSMSGCLSIKNRYQMAELLRDAADATERQSQHVVIG